MKRYIASIIITLLIGVAITTFTTGCGIYGFSEKAQLDDSIKTVNIRNFNNTAPYQNPQVAQNLTERLKQKVRNQTKLSQVNNDNAHLDITSTITDYSPSTSGVTTGTNGRQQVSINRLTVTVHVVVSNQLKGTKQEFDVSRSFDFSSSLSLQAAESGLMPEITRSMSDEIFNRLFSDW